MSAPPTANSMMRSNSCVGRQGSRPAAGVAESCERVERERAHLGLLIVAQPALRQADHERLGSQVDAQQREVAGEVGECGQQRRKLGLGEEAADLVVGLGDRLDRGDERARREGGVAHGANVT